MGTLTSCIKKAGKALPAAHAQTIREYAKDYQADGLTPAQAAQAAISDLIGELMAERAELVGEIRAAGGTAADRAAPASQPVAPVPWQRGTAPGEDPRRTGGPRRIWGRSASRQ